MPSRKIPRSIFFDWANLRAAIAGIGSEWYCSTSKSFRALQAAPCEALFRFAHLRSETLQKGAKPHIYSEISTVTVQQAARQQSGSIPSGQRGIPTPISGEFRLTTRPIWHWIILRVDDIYRPSMRERHVNFKLTPVRARSSPVAIWR